MPKDRLNAALANEKISLPPPSLLANTFTGVGHKPQDERRVDHLLKVAEDVSVYKKYREYGDVIQGTCASHVLDIGCGVGATCRNLASLVGKNGRVVGLDTSQARLKTAKRLASQTQRSADAADIEWVHGRADALPFSCGSFQGVRIERTLQHVSDAPKVLSEISRILVPGGTLIAVDPDWQNFSIETPATDPAVTKCILTFWKNSFACGSIAQRMPEWVHAAGMNLHEIKTFWLDYDNSYHLAEILFDLTRLAPAASEEGVVSEKQGSEWLKSIQEADKAETLRWAMPLKLFHARK